MKLKLINFIRNIIPIEYKYYLKKFIASLGLNRSIRQNKKAYKENKNLFKNCDKAFFEMASNIPSININHFIDSYKNKTLKPVRVLNVSSNENDPILICVVKDDLTRIKVQVEYHRKAGIRHFAYIDNMSKDGTFEWLEKQKDVSLFCVNEEFRSLKQRSWVRQAIDTLGYDKWYLDLDSDELFSYPGIEKKSITEFIDFLELKKIRSSYTLVLDMYSKNGLFKLNNSNDYIAEYCYFDSDGYRISKIGKIYQLITGGPRKRFFSNTEKTFSNNMTNYSLVKVSESMITGVHYNYPTYLNFENSLPIAFLLHYKFLPQDNIKYTDHINTGVHAGGSTEYKHYMKVYKENLNSTFYYEKSQKYNNSYDLLKINIANKVFFNEFLVQ